MIDHCAVIKQDQVWVRNITCTFEPKWFRVLILTVQSRYLASGYFPISKASWPVVNQRLSECFYASKMDAKKTDIWYKGFAKMMEGVYLICEEE